jgi:transposase
MIFNDQDLQYSIYLVLDSVDMRLGMDGLSAWVQSQLQTNPCEGNIFVFKNKRSNRIKVLKWDATGVC